MKKLASFSISIFLFCFVFAGVQTGTSLDARAEVITGSTSMTVVYVREWRSGKAANGSIADWKQSASLYNYHIHVPGQSWEMNPNPLPFRPFAGGGAGAIWNVFDEGGRTGNRSYVAWAWDGIGTTNTSKHEGAGGRSSDNWYGLMLSTWCGEKACNGKERTNLIFTNQY